MRASARLEGPDGRTVVVHPGDLVGRTERSALRLDDPRVSEAHALVSLRAGSLKLLRLRGVMRVGRRRVDEVELSAGLTVFLAPGIALHVVEVVVPSRVMAVSIREGEPQPLMGSVHCLVGPPLALLPGYRDDALAHVWTNGDGWVLRRRDQAPCQVVPGLELPMGGTVVRFVEVPVEGAGAKSTLDAGKVHASLHLVARYHSVHIHRVGYPVLTLSGQPAVLLSELVALDGPVGWQVLAKLVWRRLQRPEALRKKLDATLLRLRKKLAGAAVRGDLVRADGTGRLELVRYEGDRIEDLT